jgi:hypothetical protein
MNPRPFVWTAGVILILIGIAGFIPPLAPVESDPLRVAAGVGGAQLFGLLPVSPVLNVLHLALGGWAIYSGRRLARSVRFARRSAFIFAALTIMGMVPGADTLFGGGPLYGNNILLHGLLALLSFLFGWLYRRPVAVTEPVEPETARVA